MIPEEPSLSNSSIEILKQLIARGDEHAFRKMFNAYAPRLTGFAFSITKSKEASIEILDEVFVKIWKHKERLPEITNLTTYLYTATKNTAFNFLSRTTKEHYFDTFDFINIELTEERPDQQLITLEIRDKINKAVEALPPKCKVIFKLVREDGLKYKEVAEILGISEKTVDAQMVIAVKRIGSAVGKYFDYFPARFQKK